MEVCQERIFNNYSIYALFFPSGEIYIGATSKKPSLRWSNGVGYRNCASMRERIKRYGWENIGKRVLISGLTLEMAQHLEKYAIQYVKNSPFPLVNTLDGGDGLPMSKEINKKIFLGESFDAGMSQEEITEIIKNKYKTGKPIHCIETGVVYPSIIEASRQLGVGKLSINKVCQGKAVSVLGYHFQYYFEKDRKPTKENGSCSKVLCVEKNMVFDSIIAAAEILGISPSSISRACNGKTLSAGGYTWKILGKKKPPKGDRHAKPVKCVETGEIFQSAGDAVRNLLPDCTEAQVASGSAAIRKACMNYLSRPRAFKLHWEYVL